MANLIDKATIENDEQVTLDEIRKSVSFISDPKFNCIVEQSDGTVGLVQLPQRLAIKISSFFKQQFENGHTEVDCRDINVIGLETLIQFVTAGVVHIDPYDSIHWARAYQVAADLGAPLLKDKIMTELMRVHLLGVKTPVDPREVNIKQYAGTNFGRFVLVTNGKERFQRAQRRIYSKAEFLKEVDSIVQKGGAQVMEESVEPLLVAVEGYIGNQHHYGKEELCLFHEHGSDEECQAQLGEVGEQIWYEDDSSSDGGDPYDKVFID